MILKKITGIILNRRPHSDFDRVISIFSHEYGLISIMAKGVRKIKSRRANHLDLFNFVQMELEENNVSAIKYLREISTLQTFSSLKTAPLAFAGASVIAGFLMRILPFESPQKNLFSITKKTIEALNKGGSPQKILLTYFLKTLRLLGHIPNKLPENSLRKILWKAINEIDPQFTLKARKTLDTFLTLDKT